MASKSYSHLLAPGRIGALELRNRIVVTAMGIGFGEADGSWGERIRAYHEAQARGGAALIVSGVAGVAWPVGGAHKDQVALSDDRFIPGLAQVVNAAHAHGAKFAVQIHHGGPSAVLDLAEGRPLWVPSPPEPPKRAGAALLPDELATSLMAKITSVSHRVLTLEDIGTLIAQFAAGARRAAEAGADGVEIHAGHGYAIAAFLSPGRNRRTDAYGGPLENRARLLLEVIAAVRKAVGPDFPVWCKLDSREVGAAPGITVEDAIQTARLAEAAGVNAITVSANYSPDAPRSSESSHTPQIPCVNVLAAREIKAALGVPVICSGRIEPDEADEAIASGAADFISMGRKLLADPYLPQKLASGRAAQIRPCIYCYTCISNIVAAVPARCAVNPELGFEFQPPPRPASRKRVVVIGGGPAGMEAARRLDLDGHDVTLIEREARLGGTLRFAAIAYAPNEKLLDWLRGRIEASRVDVRLGQTADADLLRALAPDEIVVATGGVRGRFPIPGAEQDHVFTGDDLRALMLGQDAPALNRKTGWAARAATKLGAASGVTADPAFVREASRRWMPLGAHVVIIGGELVGLELAEFLAERGRRVAVIDDQPLLGAGLRYVRRNMMLEALADHGVALIPGVSEIRIAPDAVHFATSAGPQRAAADHVILAKGAVGDLRLANALREAGFKVHEAGDCMGIGYIEGAMRGAAAAARAISDADIHSRY